jgi:hypothetical protein
MASKTPNIQLIKPAAGEYFNRWNEPVNQNWDILDEEVGSLKEEVIDARGTESTLADRLNNGLELDGQIKLTSELSDLRSSTIYGSDDGTADYTIDQRIEKSEVEVWYARQQAAQLIDAMAWNGDESAHNAVLSAASNYITYAGAVVTVNGAVTPVEANISGYRQVIRTNKTTTISGASGTRYLYLERSSAGEVIYTIPSATGTVSTYSPTSKLCKFASSTGNFVTAGVKPGDILKITGPVSNPNVGDYVVLATSVEDPTNLNPNEVRIVGEFFTSSTGVDAQVVNTISPTLGVTSTAHSKKFSKISNRIYIGRCVFDGTNVTSVTIYASKGQYDEFISVTADFAQTVAHNLGYIPSKIELYGSQANDFSQPLEVLSVAEMSSGGATLTSGSVSTTPATVTFNPGNTVLSSGSQTLTYVAPTLSYTDMVVTYTAPAITYTSPVLKRSVVVRFTDTTLEVKNATLGLFYRDYGGADRTSGYLRIVCER